MKRNYLLKTLALGLTLTSIGAIKPIIANAEWTQNSGNWYYKDNSGNNMTGWQQIDGNWYYMWSDGTMAKNTWMQSNNKWYYLGNSGAMVYNSIVEGYVIGKNGYSIGILKGELNGSDIKQNHYINAKLGQNQRDKDMSDLFSYTNIEFTEWDSFMNEWDEKLLIDKIPYQIMNGQLTLEEAKQDLIGKLFKNKYVITDIKFFSIKFNTQDIANYSKEHPNATYKISIKEDIARNSNIVEYKSDSDYVYDRYGFFSSSENNSTVSEVMRVVVEFEEI